MRVFFYGTLMDLDVLRLVLGGDVEPPAVEPAILHGYRRTALRARTYPVVSPDPRGSVEGCVARGLDRVRFDRLVRYEGDEYVPRRRDIVVASGRAIEGWVFAAGPRARPIARPWSLETWQRRHKAAFMRRLRGNLEP